MTNKKIHLYIKFCKWLSNFFFTKPSYKYKDYYYICKNCKYYRKNICSNYKSVFWDISTDPTHYCKEFKKI